MKWVFKFLFLTYCFPIFSQTTIEGEVKNAQNEPLSFAKVYLKNEVTHAVIAFTSTDEKGKYKLSVKNGKFILQFSAFNFQAIFETIEITSYNKNIIKNVTLVAETVELKEVVISSEKILQKKDTIVFNAKSFLTGHEKVVEDLLKKIPGLTVANDGTIKVGNQEIEKIMIEGDDFFEKGYTLVSKNMPASPIDKVELYQHYSNNEKLKGIEESDKVALNLILREDTKRQKFGNANLGYGLASENRYEASSNLMNFGKKNKYYFLSSLNNTGIDPIGEISQLIRPNNSNGSSAIGDDQPVTVALTMEEDKPILSNRRVNFNNAEMLSLNGIFSITNKMKIKTLFFFNSDDNTSLKNSFEIFDYGTTRFENTIFSTQKSLISNGFGKIDFNYDISDSKALEYCGRFNFFDNESEKLVVFNGDAVNENLTTQKNSLDQKIVFTNKLNKNKVFLITGRYIYDESPQEYYMNKSFYQDLFKQKSDAVFQGIHNKAQFIGAEGQLLYKQSSNNLFEVKFGNQFHQDDLITTLRLISNDIINEPVDYQNQINYSTNDLSLGLKYRFTFKKLKLFSQLDIHQLYNKSVTLNTANTQRPLFINPKVGIEWLLNSDNRINGSYTFSKKNATVLEVSDQYINTSFQTFIKGTGDFNQLGASIITVNQNFSNWLNRFFINTNFTYIKNHDFFSTNTLRSASFSQSEKIVIKGRESYNIAAHIARYFEPIRGNLKLSLEGMKSNYKNRVNDVDFRTVNTQSLSCKIELRSGMKGFFNYHLGFEDNLSRNRTEITRSFSDNICFLDLYFMMCKNFDFQIKTERYYFGNIEKQYNTYYFLDLEARYEIKKNKVTFFLVGNNLLNTDTFKNYNISDISVEKSEYRLQPRYVLLKMQFNF